MAVGQGWSVAPHAVHALVLHATQGGLFQLGEGRLLAGGEGEFAEEEIRIGVSHVRLDAERHERLWVPWNRVAAVD